MLVGTVPPQAARADTWARTRRLTPSPATARANPLLRALHPFDGRTTPPASRSTRPWEAVDGPRVLPPAVPPDRRERRFWGPGFTEWTNVTAADRCSAATASRCSPLSSASTTCTLPEVRERTGRARTAHGVTAFCWWHYWFAGRRVLERPSTRSCAVGEPDFPFCLGWANQTWTGVWHGAADRILIEQTYPGADDHAALRRSSPLRSRPALPPSRWAPAVLCARPVGDPRRRALGPALATTRREPRASGSCSSSASIEAGLGNRNTLGSTAPSRSACRLPAPSTGSAWVPVVVQPSCRTRRYTNGLRHSRTTSTSRAWFHGGTTHRDQGAADWYSTGPHHPVPCARRLGGRQGEAWHAGTSTGVGQVVERVGRGQHTRTRQSVRARLPRGAPRRAHPAAHPGRARAARTADGVVGSENRGHPMLSRLARTKARGDHLLGSTAPRRLVPVVLCIDCEPDPRMVDPTTRDPLGRLRDRARLL